MADYVPVFKPGQDITLTAGSAITGGQLVTLSAANTVIPAAGTSAVWIGVARQDAASGASVVVSLGGVQEVIVAAAVVAGDVVMPAATGRVTPLTGTTYTQVVGIALTAQASAGSTCRVLFR
jgi:mannitol-specific phosphotransferase system IIBC component